MSHPLPESSESSESTSNPGAFASDASIDERVEEGDVTHAIHWKEAFSKEELRELLTIDDAQGALTLAVNWLGIAACFALVAWRANPLTILIALFALGGRQLGCAIVMHEAAHRTLFSQREWNDRLGNWLGAYPIGGEVLPYRRYHLIHHAKTGTEEDPDLGLTKPFPITKESFRRKVWRDLSGQTGWQQLVGTFKRDLGLGQKRTQRNQGLADGEKPDVGWHKVAPFLISNAAILLVLAAFGHPELYLLWIIALLTTYRLALRIRSIAEHAMSGPAEDPLRNTRTTRVSFLERVFFAPNFVNFHLEHHLLMTVPHYRLPQLHALLRERGLLDHALVTDGGYREVLQRATSG